MKRVILTAVLGAMLALPLIAAGNPNSAGNGNGDAVSDGLMGNEPNIVDPYVADTGPADLNAEDPGSVAGRVQPSGAPGPITCGEYFVGPGQIKQYERTEDLSVFLRPGNEDAPGMNVDCGSSKPHQP